MASEIKGKRGNVLADSFSGPSSYPTGGFSHRVDLGRVNEAEVQTDSLARFAKVTAINDNNAVVVQVGSEDTGGEVAGGTDLSGDTFRLTSYRD